MSSNYEKYRDNKMNQGLNTDDPEINIGLYQTPDCDNVVLKSYGGIASIKGKQQLGSAISDYVTCRGATTYAAGGSVYCVSAQDNGSETKIYARDLNSGVVTELSESGGSNTLPTNTTVRFAQPAEKLNWIALGSPSVYEWDGDLSTPVSFFISSDGTLPFSPKLITAWKNRLWLANTADDVSEVRASAYRDYKYWNELTPNSSGDLGWQGYPDSDRNQGLVAIVGNAFDTMVAMRDSSIFVLLGENEDDWGFEPITAGESAISTEAVAAGDNTVFFLGVNGIHAIRGNTEVTDQNAYGSIEESPISKDIENEIRNNYSIAEKKKAFAVYHNNKYRLNIGGTVYIFDLLSNKNEGALYRAGVEGDVGRYITYNDKLYGVGSSDGKVYLLETGDNDAGSAYSKYFFTKENDLGYPDNEKDMDYIKVFGKVDGDYNIYCDYFLDGSSEKEGTFTLDFRNVSSTSYYPVTVSTSTSVGLNFLTDTTQAWTVDELTGLYLVDSDYNSFQIISNTSDTITVEGTPSSGAYVVGHTDAVFYTLTDDDEGETWATFYSAVEIFTQAEDKVSTRGRTIKLKFYNDNADEPFEIFGYQIKFEVLEHTSLADKT